MKHITTASLVVIAAALAVLAVLLVWASLPLPRGTRVDTEINVTNAVGSSGTLVEKDIALIRDEAESIRNTINGDGQEPVPIQLEEGTWHIHIDSQSGTGAMIKIRAFQFQARWHTKVAPLIVSDDRVDQTDDDIIAPLGPALLIVELTGPWRATFQEVVGT